jgi:hypothetical protein
VYVATSLPEDTGERPEDDATTTGFVTAALAQYAAAFGR